MSEHAHFHLHEPKFVSDLEDRLRDRDSDHRKTTPRLPPIPDLRFEYSYMRSIQPFVKVTKTDTLGPLSKAVSATGEDDDDHSYEKVEFSEYIGGTATAAQMEVIEVQWSKVVWITTRDQVGVGRILLDAVLVQLGCKTGNRSPYPYAFQRGQRNYMVEEFVRKYER